MDQLMIKSLDLILKIQYSYTYYFLYFLSTETRLD